MAVLADPVFAQQSIVEREKQRRADNAREAQAALIEGDEAYLKGDWAKAVESFGKARGLLPPGARTGDLREAATERLAQASVERAKQLAKTGDFAKAEELLDTVLDPDVAPNYPAARQTLELIRDPIRYNPAVTPEHVANVDRVRRLLYTAEGFTNTGQYDRAMATFTQVLQIDPYNTAARRGMETATRHKRNYFKAAYDHTRSEMLGQVDQAWETAIPKSVLTGGLELGAIGEPNIVGGATASEKLASIRVPVVDLDQTDLNEAIDFLRQTSISLDVTELDPARRGISFIVQLGTGDDERRRKIEESRFDLKLRDIPLSKVLEYITNATGTKARVDQHAVVIRPVGATSDDLLQRSFRVPPDFLSREALNGEAGGDIDPFGDDDAPKGLVRKLTPQEFLKKHGVSFPPGASARYSTANGVLTVRNTQSNLDYVDQIVKTIADEEPLMITVEARIIRSTQNNLEELGFDWLLGNFNVTGEGDLFLGGGTTGNGTPISNNPFVNPVTAGNRSGNAAAARDSIDAVIARSPGDESLIRAPGSMQALWVLNDGTVATLMRGINQHKGIDLLTKKSVITRSGQAATIHSIQEFIYPTEYEPPELPNSIGSTELLDLTTNTSGVSTSFIATPATPTAFETTNLGCEMEVLPQVGADRKLVELSIKPQIRRFDGFVDYGTPITGGSSSAAFTLAGVVTVNNTGEITSNNILMPVISTTRGETNLVIADGETVVMGGLLNNSRLKIEDKTPILGDIPFFGRFFQSDVYTNVRDAYVILVTVRLQDPSGELINRR